jgi:hypothetical protein
MERARAAGTPLLVIAALLSAAVLAGCAGSAGSGSQSSQSSDAPSSVVASRTVPQTQTVAPTEPVSKPVELAQVTAPPEATVAMIDPSKAQAGSKYSIAFVPYGTGPGPGGPESGLVIRISKSTPDKGVKNPYDFNGRNVLVDASTVPTEQAVKQGGNYDGTLVLVEQSKLLVPRLERAAVAGK